jgi:GTP-binding protein
MHVKSAEFIKSATAPSHYPVDQLPEVAFAGKSNVGKSSLINTLVGRKRLARISAAPGKTRLINFFKINSELYFVDLPGYGYAKVSRAIKETWGPMIEGYLKHSSNLDLVILILDIRRDLAENDLDLIHWLSHYRRRVVFVLTKIDKLSKNDVKKRSTALRTHLERESDCHDNIILFSSKTGDGKETLWNMITEAIR